ncbi:NHL repeat-containing protein [Salisediminibacterium beveridgei]|uniref:NHL repeat containing protein n=1 Tax=Salisediminibacterium beveridgei TaxID=632773 RepID=A0A1D7QYB0_9BACI|nr:hypothetical protein [Salisediminibacterium beveridgei]AOM83994.1 NHL repeat containing protein [Salisediminibacterium beveridgei]
MLIKKWLIPLTGLMIVSGCFGSDNDDAEENLEPNDNSPEESDEVQDGQEDSALDLSIGAIASFSGLNGMGYADGNSEETQFNHPADIIPFDEGFLVADSGNHLIRYVSMSGQSETFAGGYEIYDDYGEPEGGFKDGASEDARFDTPLGLIFDEESDTVYVADAENGAIRSIDEDGNVETLREDLEYPTSLVIMEENLIVSDAGSHRIQQIDLSSGDMTVLAGGDYEQEDGREVGRFVDGQGEEAGFNEPFGLAVSGENIIVADSGNQRIRQVTGGGEVTTIAGTGEDLIPGADYIAPGIEDGPTAEAKFNFPRSVEVLADDAILVADTYNHRIRLITDDEVIPVAGHGVHGLKDGSVEEALFDGPYSVAVFDERIWVTDHWNHMVRAIELTN